MNEAYVAECLNLAENMYNGLHVGTDLLIVYEDCYSEREQENIFFFESCLKGIGQTESYCFFWKFSPMKETYPAALANNQEVHVCTRRLYEAKDIDTRRLFLEIICSDIGGKYDLASKVFILDMATSCLFHLYDDRGLWVSKPAEKRAK
ncbi:hypothetical protein Ami103574_01740 [Aminipila butyrica]|uniref:DUF3885 domain-containing protein n=1 Tax=Aminipila butyrica TaxID=433296 RepID=A0A858BSC4_9FIRM|nr:hypothetical protein [Aminipila butyrica]QIB68109.1 hypothetical protein Ami103574_01740 [Aminipila butyrica]